MIKQIEINGVHTVVTDDLKKYITKKISKLSRYLPRHARDSVRAEVFVKELAQKSGNRCICEVVLHLPQDNITVNEATVNMFAAVDIVEAKLKNQIKKYKETHGDVRLRRRLFARFKRSKQAEALTDTTNQ